jgi:hypothetical protein
MIVGASTELAKKKTREHIKISAKESLKSLRKEAA